MPDNATVRRITIGCRYPVDHVALLDAIARRRGYPDRAACIRAALDHWIEMHLPGSLRDSQEAGRKGPAQEGRES